MAERVYVFGNEATAEAFKMTAYHFGIEAERVGSALVMDPEGYVDVLAKTYAIPAAIVAVVKTKTFSMGHGITASITRKVDNYD